MNRPNPLFKVIISVISLALVGGAVFISSTASAPKQAITSSQPVDTNQPIATAPPVDTPVATPVAAKPTAPVTTKYKDGSYSTTISYDTPESQETMQVTLSIKNDTVTDSSLSMSGYAPESRRYQNAFASNYKAYIVGKNVDSIRLSRVSGASLTTGGFNDALSKIKSRAL